MASAVITELADFSISAFYDNRTWLNQENWQAYFGGSLPSGVVVDGGLKAEGQYYSNALTLQTINESYKAFRPGKIIVDGIFAEYNANTNIPVIKNSEVDRLIVARVYVLAGYVKIVSKTQIAAEAGYTPVAYAGMLLRDESLGCVRDGIYYEIPLLYEIYGVNSYDLRRLYYLPCKEPPFLAVSYNGTTATNLDPDAGVLYGKGFVNVYGGMNYDIDIYAYDTSTYLSINPVPMCSAKPITVYIKNNSDVDKEIRLPINFKSLTLSYEWIDNWDMQSNSYMYRELLAHDKIALILTPFTSDERFGYTVTSKGVAGGAIDPEDYYTKTEVNLFLAEKADTTYVDAGLATKANASSLGTLAYKDSVNYSTEVTNKPTLGSLASKNKASLTADVSGILPIENGGTGANNLAGIINAVVGSKTYYVNSSGGSDSNPGTSGSPFATISKAIDSCGYLLPCTIYAKGTFLENIVIPNGKYITLISNGAALTITGRIEVNGGKFTINSSLNGTVTVSANYKYGAVTALNGAVVIIQAVNRASLSIVNAYVPITALQPQEGYAIWAEYGSVVDLTSNDSAQSSITGNSGVNSLKGSNVLIPTGTGSGVTITYTFNKFHASYGMINNATGNWS